MTGARDLDGESVVTRALRALERRAGEAVGEVVIVDAEGVASAEAVAARAAAVAAALVRAGASPGDRVGVLAGKGRHETAALLGVWRANCAAVPLDTTSPELRNRSILDAAGVRLALRTADVAQDLARETLDPAAVPEVPVGPPTPVPHSDREAVVLHTSGSTGTPKGVPVSHLGVSAFVDWMVREFDVRSGDAVAALASPSFDLALFEQLAPLAAGGRIVRPGDRLALSVRRLAAFLDEHRVSCVYAVPSFFVRLLGARPLPPFEALRTVLFAGETFPVESLRALRAALPGRRFANLFGPTETNVTLFHELAPDEPAEGADAIPIGRPCPYAEVALVAADGRESESAGEVAARGATVLAGYAGREAPAVRTVVLEGRGPQPFLLTGDRATRDAEGRHWFGGRLDDMLKVRGFRVEPGEVERALASFRGVRDVVVRRVVHEALGELLRADVVVEAGAAFDAAALRAHAAARVPAYMVPTEVVQVDDLPRSARGKRRR